MVAGLKIVLAVVVYRLRRLEMANLAAATSIALALHLPLFEVVWRTAFAFVLNVLVYLNNDYVDVAIDLASSDKDSDKTRYLSEHMGAALGAQWGLALALTVFAFVYDLGLLIPLVVGGGICVWYSAYLKRIPYCDIPAMMVWGLAMPACGVPWNSVLGWALATELGLFSGVFESIQVIRDADEDALEGVRTTAVALGKNRTLWLARALMVVSTAYAALVLHPIAGVISAAALVIPFPPHNVPRYWTHVKLTYGITWLFIVGYVFVERRSAGLLWAIDAAAAIK